MGKVDYKNIIGDGKLPNKYFLFVSNDYSYIHDKGEDGIVVDWIGDLIKGFESKGDFIGMFDSYKEAKEKAEEFYLGMHYGGYTINRITIEDRLSGELFECTKVFSPMDGDMSEDLREDTSFTEETMEEKGLIFS